MTKYGREIVKYYERRLKNEFSQRYVLTQLKKCTIREDSNYI